MTCERIRKQLTAYLDGELDGERGTLVRGHLRTCGACRTIAEDEAALRDGLRALPSLDPPSTLWAGVQARLAAEEVAAAEQPSWKRMLARARRWLPSTPQLAAGGVLAAAAVALIVWRTQGGHEAAPIAVHDVQSPKIESHGVKPPPPPAPAPVQVAACASSDDVSADLAAEPACVTEMYRRNADELLALANDAKPSWAADRRAAFDTKVRALREGIASAAEGKPRQRAYRALIRYLEGAAIREDVALASVGGAR
ncbi:MAG TPA: anti-sigma factor [Kofleriaceae bacterium]|nr:anti-sigma factor [Kofleriaceae bacterium]